MASIFDGTPVSFSSNISAKPWKIVSGDIDNDGDVDIITHSRSGTTAEYGYSIGLNDGNGDFAFTNYQTSFQVRDLELFDLGNDSSLDIVILGKDHVETSSGTILVPSGTFNDAYDFSISNLGAGDTGPGDTTIRIVDRAGKRFYAYENGSSGSLIFSQTANVDSGAKFPESIATGFINNDQATDSVIANYGEGSDRFDLDLFLGNPPLSSSDLGVGQHPKYVDLTDIDQDGDLDITSINFGSQSTSVILNNGDGTFSSETTYPTQGQYPFSMIYTDEDNDGNLDQVVATRRGAGLSIRHGLGNGTFGSFTSKTVSGANYMVAADFDGDNREDLLWTLNGGGISGYISSGIPPVFVSAATSTDGTKVILTYNEVLSATTATASDFVVTVDGSTVTVSSVATAGTSIELTLSSAIQSGQSVTFAYTDPSNGDDTNATQDSAGNDAASLTSTSVTNAVTASRSSSSSSSLPNSSSSGNDQGTKNSTASDTESDGLEKARTATDGSIIDGNRDGIPDSQQSLIAELRLMNDGSTASDYGAIEVATGIKVSASTLSTANKDNSLRITTSNGDTALVSLPDNITNAFTTIVSLSISQSAADRLAQQATLHLPDSLPAGRGNAYIQFNYRTNRFEHYLDESGNPLYRLVDTNSDGLPDAINLTLIDGDQNWDGDQERNGAVATHGFFGYGELSFRGTKHKDRLTGNALSNSMSGRGGNDRIFGDLGTDQLKGGKGKDRFIYRSAEESTVTQQDTVSFGKKDRFDFRSFDGDSITEGQQSLRYIGKKAFSGAAGELRFTGSGLQADTTGDGQADFVVNFAKATPWFSEANILI